MITVAKKPTAKKAKKGKPGRPPGPSLVIKEDPQAALARLLNPPKAKTST